MIKFRQKEFSEYDAMKALYNEIMKRTNGDRTKYPVINTSALLPILKGNNIVIERFVISTSLFGKDVFRMYIKVGARAKLPDQVRLTGKVYDKRLCGVSFSISNKLKSKVFSKKSGKSGGSGGDGQPQDKKKEGDNYISAGFYPDGLDIKYQVNELLGDAIKYDKVERLLVLEFPSINNAIDALNILPFGLNYKIYILDA